MNICKPYVSKRKRSKIDENEKSNTFCHTGSTFCFPEKGNNLVKDRFNFSYLTTKYFYKYNAKISTIDWSHSYHDLCLISSLDGSLEIWNIKNIDKLQSFKFDKGVSRALWFKSNDNIVCTSYCRNAVIFDVEKGSAKTCFDFPQYITSLAIHPLNDNIIVLGSYNELVCWDIRSNKNPQKNYHAMFGNSLDTVFLPDCETFINSGDSVSRDATEYNILAWDFRAKVIMSNQIYKEKYTCPKLCLAKNEKDFYAQSNGNYIAVFQANAPYKMNKHRRYQGHRVEGYAIGMDQTADGNYLLSGSSDGKVYIYNAKSGGIIKTWQPIAATSEQGQVSALRSAITAIAINPHTNSSFMLGSENGDFVHVHNDTTNNPGISTNYE